MMALYNDSKRQVYCRLTGSESRLLQPLVPQQVLQPLVPQQVVSNTSQKDVSEHLAWYTKKCNASVIATIPLIPFPLPARDTHTPQQVRANSTKLPDGN